MASYDLIVVGGGPAGYVGAIKAAQLGKKSRLCGKGTRRRNLPELGLYSDEIASPERRALPFDEAPCGGVWILFF